MPKPQFWGGWEAWAQHTRRLASRSQTPHTGGRTEGQEVPMAKACKLKVGRRPPGCKTWPVVQVLRDEAPPAALPPSSTGFPGPHCVSLAVREPPGPSPHTLAHSAALASTRPFSPTRPLLPARPVASHTPIPFHCLLHSGPPKVGGLWGREHPPKILLCALVGTGWAASTCASLSSSLKCALGKQAAAASRELTSAARCPC